MSILIIIFLALGLRLSGIGQSLWMDEAISATAVKTLSLTEVWNKFPMGDTHPPLYYIVLKIWTTFFGYSEVSLRLPSVIFGTATVYVVYLIAKRFFKGKSVLLPSVLLATSGLHIYYSQEARMYALSTLLVAICVYLYLRQKWLGLSAILLLLGMTDYYPLTILFVFVCWSLVSKENKRHVYGLFASFIPLIVFYLYWGRVVLAQGQASVAYLANNPWWGKMLGEISFKNTALVWIKFIIGRVDFESATLYGLVVLYVTFVFGFIIFHSFKNLKKTAPFYYWFIIPLVLLFLSSLKYPGFAYFRLLFVLPAFYIILSFGISSLKNRMFFLVLVVTINMFFSFIYLGNSRFHREDWKNMVPFVESRLNTGDIVVVNYPEPFTPYLWYAGKKDSVVPFSEANITGKTGLFTLDYLMDVTDPERNLFGKLENLGFRQLNIYNFRGTGQVRYWKINTSCIFQ